MKTIWRIGTLAALLLSAGATAEDSLQPTDPVLAGLIEQAKAARPEIAEARALVAAGRERVPQAGALPDPMLQIGVQNDSFTSWEVGEAETSWYSIMGSQSFPWPGKRKTRSAVEELGASLAESSVARLLLTTEAEVRRSYLGLLLARDRLALLVRLEAIWQKSATLARSRYEIGQGAQSDVLRAQLEINRLKQRRFALEVDAETETQNLNRLRGHPLDEPIETARHLADVPLPELPGEEAAAEDALERSPELAAARLGARQAEQAARLAGKDDRPDLTVNAGVMPRGGEFPTMWLVSVGSTIPIFSRSKQNRAVAESEARLLAAERNIEALEQVLRLRIAQRCTALAAALETVGLYRDGLLVQSAATADSTLVQYEVGRVPFASVLEANLGLIEDEEGYLQALAQAQRLQIDHLEVSLAAPGPNGEGGGSSTMFRRAASGRGGPSSSSSM